MRNKEYERKLNEIFALPPAKMEAALGQLIKTETQAGEFAFAHDAAFQLAAFCYENEKVTKAKRILLPIVSNYVKFPFIPRYANMFMLLGVIELGEEDYTLANYYFSTGLKLAKAHRLPRVICLAYSNLAIVSSALNRHEAALEQLLMAKKYIEYASPDQHVLIYLNLAVCYKLLNRLDESEKSLQTCVNEFHGLESGRRALIQCCAMDLYYKKGDTAQYEKYKNDIIKEAADKPSPDRMQAYQMICENAFAAQDYELCVLMLGRLKKSINQKEDMATNLFIVKYEGKLAKLHGETDEYIKALENQLALSKEMTEMNSRRLIKSTGIEIRLSQLMRKNEETLRAREEEKKHREELSRALTAARQANAAKSEFLSRMSHDIRTPMNAILGFAELSKQDADKKDLLMGDLERISSAGEFLLGLVNDILDMTKIESHAMELKNQPYPLADFKQQIETLTQPLCNAKNILFMQEAEQGVPDCLYVDRLRFNQIFFNLLSNAVKFTPENGHISLAVKKGRRKTAKPCCASRCGMTASA